MSDLPKGWITIRTGDVGDWRGGGTPSKANSSYWTDGTIPWVSPKDMKRSHIAEAIDSITDDAVAGSATQLIPEGSVLVVTRSGILQHSLPVAANTVPVAINQDLKALTPRAGIETEFVMRQLQADAQEILKTCAKSGTTVDSIDFDRLKDHEFRLPPLPEQRRIVAKVDGLTARTARARKELDRIPTLIARYKQRLLALALCGSLTADWRNRVGYDGWLEQGLQALATRRSEYEKSKRGSRLRPAPPLEAGEIANLPSSWISCCVADVADLRVGYAFKSQWFSSKGARLIRGANVAPGRIDWSDEKRLSPEHIASYEDYRLATGDVVIAMDRPLISTGLKIAIVSEEDSGALLVQRVANPRPTPWLNAKYMFYLFNGQGFISQIENHATGSDLPHISGNDILTTAVPLPPLDEQAEIVRRIESAFGRLDRMAADHAAAARLLLKLDAAILAKAFRGELIPQDPNDEPASLLLERIKVEQEARDNAPKKMRKPNASKAQVMIEKPLTPRDRLMKDSENWPAVGLPFEAIAMRNSIPHDALRDALFELLAGTLPVLQQRFDTDAEVMVIQRVAT